MLDWLGTHIQENGTKLKEICCVGRHFPIQQLDTFFGCFTGLHHVEISDLEPLQNSLDVSSLSGHSNTLEHLKLTSGINTSTAAGMLAVHAFYLVALVEKCKNLKELCLALPMITAAEMQGQNWGMYENTLTRVSKNNRA